jgi:acyl carrier protein
MKDRIRTYIMENILLGSADQAIEDDDSFLEKGIIDSTGILELVAFVEDEFEIEVSDEELIPDNFDSIEKLAAYTQMKIGSQA